MPAFLRNLHIDALSFWLGFLIATLFWFFFRRLRRYWPKIRIFLMERAEALRQNQVRGLEDRLRKEILHRAQATHLAWSLCPLDEILITPRLLTPPAHCDPGELTGPGQIRNSVLSHLPEWPEIAAQAGADTVCLEDVLESGVPVALVGHPGSGRSVALAAITSKLCRGEIQVGPLAGHFPLLIHAMDLTKTTGADELLYPLITAVSGFTTGFIQPQVASFVRKVITENRCILLIDGLDEIPQGQLKEVSSHLGKLINEYPGFRMAVSGSLDTLDGLIDLGFTPVAMAAWTESDYSAFLQKWEHLWMDVLLPDVIQQPQAEPVDPLLLNHWLLADRRRNTPLELTLMAWGSYAGDTRGLKPGDAIESHIRRLTSDPEVRSVLEKLAFLMTVTEQPVISRNNAGSLIAGAEQRGILGGGEESSSTTDGGEAKLKQGAIQRDLPNLVQNGLLVERLNERISFGHPVFMGYLAAQAAGQSAGLENLLAQRAWSGKTLVLNYLANLDRTAGVLPKVLQESEEPLYHGLFAVSRWLKDAPASAVWRAGIMRQLVEILQSDTLPMAARQRALAGLIISDDPGISVLFRQMIQSEKPPVRQLGLLGLGYSGDVKYLPELNALLNDPVPIVRYAACLGLGMLVPNGKAVDTLTQALVRGDEELRRPSAEELARFPQVGHPLLAQFSTSEDLLVRRAVVYGLLQVNQPWALEILEKMRVEDGQWVVRNAASHALESQQYRTKSLPHPLLPPSQSPWLITYAGKNGTGIPAGDPATNLIISALEHGTEDEQVAALRYLRRIDDPEVIEKITTAAYHAADPVREAAFEALWVLSLKGAAALSPIPVGVAH